MIKWVQIDSMRELAELWPRGQNCCIPGIPLWWCKQIEQKGSALLYPSSLLPFHVLSHTHKFSPSWCSSCLAVSLCLHSFLQCGWGRASSESFHLNKLCLLRSSKLSSLATVRLFFWTSSLPGKKNKVNKEASVNVCMKRVVGGKHKHSFPCNESCSHNGKKIPLLN